MRTSLTVIIPVLNGMPYLREALASLEVQTFRDFTVILWDNGSTDGTVKEAREWIPARLPGRVVSGEHLPLHECLARMVEQSESTYCARMDADDIALPDRFEKQMTFLHKQPEVAAVGGQIEVIDFQSQPIGLGDHSPVGFPGILLTMLWRNPMSHPAMIFRRQAVLSGGNYRANMPVEDYDLWLRLSHCERLANLSDVVLKYRLHDASVCAREKQDGVLVPKIHECAAHYSSELFGLKEPEARALLARKAHCALFMLERVLVAVARRTGFSKASLRRLPEFHAAGRAVCHQNDVLTRIYLAILEARAEGKSITRLALDKLKGLM